MRTATICSGIGAPEAARPDLDWLWHAEVEPFPSAVMAVRHPGSVNLGDITADDFIERAARIGTPEILIGGTPCQGFSIAGLRKSLGDDRGNVSLVAVRLVHALGCAFLWENVPGLLSLADNPFGCILGGLVDGETAIEPTGGRWTNAGVAAGPRGVAAWRVLDAQGYVPQRRERVFLLFVPAGMAGRLDPCRVLFELEADALVSLGDRAYSGPLFPLAAGLRGYPEEGGETWERTARPLGAGSPRGSGYRNDADTADNLIAHCLAGRHNQTRGGDLDTYIPVAADVSPPITSNPYGDHESREGLLVAAYGGNDTRSPHGRLDFESETFVAHAFDARQSDVCQYGDIAAPLDTDGHTIGVLAEPWQGGSNQDQVCSPGGVAPTLAFAGGTHGGHHQPKVMGTLPILESGKRTGASSTSRKAGDGLGQDGDPMFTLGTDSRHAVAVDLQNCALGGEVSGTLDTTRPTRGGGQAAAYDIHGTPATSGATATDVHTPLRSRQPGMSEASTTTVINGGVAIRRLLPSECEKLMGLEPGYTAITYRGKEAADGNRYRALGNSMAVPVLTWLLTRIEAQMAATVVGEEAA